MLTIKRYDEVTEQAIIGSNNFKNIASFSRKRVPVLFIPIKVEYENIYGDYFYSKLLICFEINGCSRFFDKTDGYFKMFGDINVIDTNELDRYLSSNLYYDHIWGNTYYRDVDLIIEDQVITDDN